MPAVITPPKGTLPDFDKSKKEKENPGIYGSREGPWNNVKLNKKPHTIAKKDDK